MLPESHTYSTAQDTRTLLKKFQGERRNECIKNLGRTETLLNAVNVLIPLFEAVPNKQAKLTAVRLNPIHAAFNASKVVNPAGKPDTLLVWLTLEAQCFRLWPRYDSQNELNIWHWKGNRYSEPQPTMTAELCLQFLTYQKDRLTKEKTELNNFLEKCQVVEAKEENTLSVIMAMEVDTYPVKVPYCDANNNVRSLFTFNHAPVNPEKRD